ncbi:MAG TPA: protein kinase [Bryobacteraceae bacterium]|nr:protein kinase [Bryobacteraceae bacterium]
MQGQHLGSYEILDKLGEGGMGEVWRARDERLNRTVAVKILPADLANDPARRARFEQEARSLGALNHPNIVAVYDVGQDNGRSYIVSELVDGESLRSVIDRGPLPMRKLIDYGVQMAEALAAAHELGIVHRDLKPENVMVTRAGRVKVLDFGLAKQNVAAAAGDRTATMALSQPGMVMGTAGYMSPEQVRGEPVDARSDIFSLGCVLYEMIGGRRAFQAPSSVETMNAILKEDPPDLDPGTSPPALSSIIRRCLEKRPEQRFQSAADLAFALHALTPSSSSTAPGPVAVPRRRWITWAVAIAAGAALFAAGYFARTFATRPTLQQYQRITFRKGLINNARFTPDGRNIIYEASWEGGPSRIYLAIPGNPNSRDLGIPPSSSLLAISSKEELAYADASGNLMRGSITGGQMRPLLDNVAAADWSPDGEALAVLRRVNGKFRVEYPIGTVIADDIRFPLETIRISPDGTRVAYISFFRGRAVGLHIVDGNKKQQYLGEISGQTSSNIPFALCWSPKGDEIWFRSFDSNDTQTIYAIDLKGRRRVLANLPANVELYDISRQGAALLSAGSVRWGILGTAPGDSQERDLSCLDGGVLMGISSDGGLIAATVTGEGAGPKGSVYARRTDGSPPLRLGDGSAYSLSPDGKWVSGYVVDDNGLRRFVLLPTGAGEEITVDVPGLKPAAVFGWLAGDQRYLVTGRVPPKGYQCFAWDAKHATVKPVCPEGTPDRLDITASPDGTKVLNAGIDGNGWFVYPVDGGPAQEVKGIGPDEMPTGWRADNQSLYVRPHRAGDMSTPVWIVDIATGKRTLWKEIRPSQPIDFRNDLHLHITPDGRAYAYNFSMQSSDLYLAQGLR